VYIIYCNTYCPIVLRYCLEYILSMVIKQTANNINSADCFPEVGKENRIFLIKQFVEPTQFVKLRFPHY
jgi:hypothetical protein